MRCPNVLNYRIPLARGAGIFCVLTFLAGCGAKGPKKPDAEVTIQNRGSDTLVHVAQAWAEEYKKVKPAVEVEVSGGGSGQGIAALIKGNIDLANSSRNIKQEERELTKKNTGKDPVEFIIGYDALAIFVHESNPLEEISFEQLYEIYAEHGKVTKWSDMGVSIPKVKKDTIVRVSRQSSSGTYELFRELVMKKHDFKLGSRDMNGSKEVVELVAAVPTAIGYSGMGYARPGVKMLKVRKGPGAPSIAPTVETTISRAYPISRSLLLYTVGEPEGPLKEYIEWIQSPPGQKLVQENGYVPAGPTS